VLEGERTYGRHREIDANDPDRTPTPWSVKMPRYKLLHGTLWEPRLHMPEERAQRRLAAILAADVVGYSRMMQADEAGTLEALKVRHKPH